MGTRNQSGSYSARVGRSRAGSSEGVHARSDDDYEGESGSLEKLRLRLREARAQLKAAEERQALELAAHQATEAELQYRVGFENLITALSTEFISLKTEQIDSGIERALRRIAAFTGDDRSWVVLYHADGMMENTHEWRAPGVRSCVSALRGVPVTVAPWTNERILRGEVVHIPRVGDLDAPASIDQALMRSLGTKSAINVPMVFRDATIGCLGFDSVRRSRSWSDETVVLLRAVGEMFVNALERKWIEEDLLESQQALTTLMSNLPGMAFRVADGEDGTFEFVSEGCTELTGYVPSDLVHNPTLARALMVHERDRASLRRAARKAVEDQSAYQSTHRILTADGEVKWVLEQGRGVTYPRRELPVLEGFMMDVTDRMFAYQRLEERVGERTREIERRRTVADGLRVVVEALNDSRPIPGVLDLVVDQASRLLGTPRAAIFRLRPDRRVLSVKAARGLCAEGEECSDYVVSLETVARMSSQSDVLAIEDTSRVADHELVRELMGIHRKSMGAGCQALVFVPLVLTDEIYGALVFFYADPRDFSDEDVELARILGDQATLAIGNSWLRLQAEENAAAKERAHIASELHDSVTQLLFSANLIADALPSALEEDPEEAERQLEQLRTLTRQALAEMRGLILELRPSAIEEAGLDRAFGSLVRTTEARGGVPIRLTIKGDAQLPPSVQLALYRIAQEALNNVIRHARAEAVEIALRGCPRGVTILISDDGIGFDPDAIPTGHFGLAIMRERAEAIGARLGVKTAKGGGTRIGVHWPNSPDGSRP